MITLTKEQLADLLRAAYRNGFEASAEGWNFEWGCMDPEGSKDWVQKREEDILPLVHRSSGGHNDHGRDVVIQPAAAKLVLPTPEQVMHVVMKFQWEDRKNGTGTTNWAANLGMTVVEYVARLNAGHEREVE